MDASGTGGQDFVLIEPLWNWNCLPIQDKDTKIRLNRTFMELKLAIWASKSFEVSS